MDGAVGGGLKPRFAGSRARELALLAAVLALAAAVRLPGVFSRSIWYDEAISLLTAAGHADPPWPRRPAPAAAAQELFSGSASLPRLIDDVRRYDVHPPGYYWALGLWSRVFGAGLESARWFSLICSLAAVLAFYLLLRAAGLEGALPVTLVYALSTGAAHGGHEARAYGLAGLLLAGAAWLGWVALERAAGGGRGAAACAFAAAAGCGLAFHVNYLTLFPAAAILGWFALHAWRASRALAVAVPAAAMLIGALGVATLRGQLDQRTEQLKGFVGVGPELSKLLELNAQTMGFPLPEGGSPVLHAAALGTFVALLGLTAATIVRRWPSPDRRLFVLAGALALAPSAGILLLDALFDKQLHVSRYLSFAGPGLALLLGYGLVTLIASKQKTLGVVLLAGLLAIQASNLNWGLEVCPNSEFGGESRTLARWIRTTSSSHHLVVLAEGYNRAGNPGHLVYELDPGDPIVTFGHGTDLDQLMAEIARYDDAWIVFSLDTGTLEQENELLRRLRASGRYRGIHRQGIAFHLMNLRPPAADGLDAAL